jgi:histidine triad (HIT) family protein
MTSCLFCKIAKKEIPAKVVYEDEDVLAFLDIKPVHPGHVLVIPKRHSDDMTEMDPVDLQSCTSVAQRIARVLLAAGYDGANVTTNIKPAGHQVVFHTHFHVIPRKTGDGLKTWPQHDYKEGDMEKWQEKLRGAIR